MQNATLTAAKRPLDAVPSPSPPTKLVIMRLTHIHYWKFWCDGGVCRYTEFELCLCTLAIWMKEVSRKQTKQVQIANYILQNCTVKGV